MINTVPVKRKTIGFVTLFSDNRFFIISLGILLLGMLLGALSVGKMGDGYLTALEKSFNSFIDFRNSAGFLSVFFKAFFLGTAYVFLISVSAFGVSGLGLIPVAVFFRGFGTTALAGLLYRNHSLLGIAFADLILLPSCLIMDFIIIYLSSKALSLSCRYLTLLKDVSSKGISIRPFCGELLKKLLWCMIAVVISSLIEAAFSACFIKYFNF
jgi:hypothetical protein